MEAQCLITGCAFGCPETNEWIWGDLFQFGDMLFLNAKGGSWSATQLPEDTKIVACPVHCEKNELVMFPLALTKFNKAAHDHVLEGMPATLLNATGGLLQ